MLLRNIRDRLTKSYPIKLEEQILARIQSGEWTEETLLSVVVDTLFTDSLDVVDFQMTIEEESNDVPINTVGDLLWLLKAIEFRRQRRRNLS
jgi:hypothetical protein